MVVDASVGEQGTFDVIGIHHARFHEHGVGVPQG